jgi:hypothetical protein
MLEWGTARAFELASRDLLPCKSSYTVTGHLAFVLVSPLSYDEFYN